MTNQAIRDTIAFYRRLAADQESPFDTDNDFMLGFYKGRYDAFEIAAEHLEKLLAIYTRED